MTIAYKAKKGWLHINTEGEPISQPYAQVGYFSEGLAAAYLKYGAENEAVYIDELGNRVFNQTFGSSGRFKNGIARVVQNSKVFWINKKGENAFATGVELATQPSGANRILKRDRVFYTAGDFSEGLVVVRDFPRDLDEMVYELSRYAYMNMNGNNAFPGRVFRYARDFSEGVAWVSGSKDGSHPTLINRDGEEVFRGSFYKPRPFSEGTAIVNAVFDPVEPDCPITNEHYFINKQGEDITDRRFIGAHSFSEGLAAVNLANSQWGPQKWTFVDKDIDPVFPKRKFSSAESFSEGLAVVEHPISRSGSWKYCYIDTSGEQAFDGVFDSACSFNDGVAYVDIKDKGFYINHEGKKVFGKDY